MTWLSFQTTTIRCRTRQLAWQQHQQKLDSRSTWRKQLIKINTTAQIPVTVGDKSIKEVESFIYLGSVVDRLCAQTLTSSQELARQELHFPCLKTYGPLRTSALPPSYGSLTPTLSPSYCMDQRPGRQQNHLCRGSKPSKTPVSGAS